ncbi:MAG: ribosome hibernation-promoting factor, HPF/YfiA family [Streptosporangiaceae bacterium]
MDVIVKGRRTGIPQRFREHATNKLAKVQKLDPKVIRIDVEVSKERNPRQAGRRERIELTCRSRGPAIRAEACADDRYAALDLALARLKERLRKAADRRKVHHGSHTPRSVAAVTAVSPLGVGEGPAPRDGLRGAAVDLSAELSAELRGEPGAQLGAGVNAGTQDESQVTIPAQGDGPLVVREKTHRADPMTLDQALFEMELVGHDFYLFRDRDSDLPSVVYRRRGFDYGVIRLQER